MVGDNKINPFNVTDNMLRANLSNVQQSGNYVDYLSNGFKPRLSGNAFNNQVEHTSTWLSRRKSIC